MNSDIEYGPCAKRRVVCTITFDSGTVVRGENLCANPQKECPRLPGDGYTKCDTVCRQVGHAEEVAVMKAKFYGLRDGKAHIEGHGHACGGCIAALQRIGVTEITIGREHL